MQDKNVDTQKDDNPKQPTHVDNHGETWTAAPVYIHLGC